MVVSLNEGQRKAVEHEGGPLLVVAGPGSGKTRVIVERVKHLITKGFRPAEILCLTFSEKAAAEMQSRIEKEAGTTEVETSTFHSFCLSILEDSVLETGVSFKSGLISRTNQLVWGLKNIDSFNFEYIEVGNNAVDVIESIVDGISAFRDELVSPAKLKEYLTEKKAELEQLKKNVSGVTTIPEITSTVGKPDKKRKPKERNGADEENGNNSAEIDERIGLLSRLEDLQKVYERYEQFKRKESLIDYDDMIQVVIELFKSRSDVLKRYQNRYAHVLVDEFQDNNYAQLELVKLLCPSGNVTVVGDDDQSIYRFRGAYLTVFDDFREHFKENATTVKLERNYRSTKNVVALAKQLLDPVPNRVSKGLFSENEDGGKVIVARCATDAAEIDFVVNKIKNDLLGKELKRRDGTVSPITYRDIAVLSRRRLEGIKFARAIKAHGLPCTFIGEARIFSTPVIRDLLAYLRVADDPLGNGIEIARIMINHGVTEQNVKIINHAAKAKARELVKRIDRTESVVSAKDEDTDNNRNYGTDFVYDVMEQLVADPDSSPVSQVITQKDLIKDIVYQIRAIVELRNRSPVDQFVFELVMSKTDLYKRTLNDSSEESIRNRLILHEFLKIAQEFEAIAKRPTLKDFLDHLNLMSDFDIEIRQGEEEADSIIVTTIHQSKGKEFPIVFVVDVADRKLPLQFREKKFYCPSDLSRGLKFRDLDEKELYLQEERRLLYVAMTRAQHHLFLTLAEIYGDNVRKTKPSKFLVELNFENNPLVELVSYDAAIETPVLVSDSKVEQLKHEYQLLATKFVNQMQLKSAVEKVIELAMILHYQSGKPLSDFKIDQIISPDISVDRNHVEAQLKSEHTSLLEKDSMHFSASSLNTYQDCPLQYKFSRVLEVPTLPKTFFDLGKAVHSVVEVLTKRQINEQGYLPTKQDATGLLDRYWVSSTYQTAKAEEEDRASAEKMLEFYVRWCEQRVREAYAPFAAEKKFEIEISGKKLVGVIDRIDLTPEGEYEVFDYKTSRSGLNASQIKNDIQMNAYCIAIQKLYGKLPVSASLLYLRKEEKVSYLVSPGSVEPVRKEMEALIDGILNERFDPVPDYFTCKYCDYKSICDAKEIEDEE